MGDALRDQLAELARRVAKAREDVGAVTKAIEQLLGWLMTCPRCFRVLEKQQPTDQVRCLCGWVWG